jgi:hypothetical protein
MEHREHYDATLSYGFVSRRWSSQVAIACLKVLRMFSSIFRAQCRSITKTSCNSLQFRPFTSTVKLNMKEAIIRAGPKVEIVDSPVPKAEKGQVVIKVVYSGSNPKDWYVLDH